MVASLPAASTFTRSCSSSVSASPASRSPSSCFTAPPTATDTGLVLAAAAIGYTVPRPHPFRDDENLRVSGVARTLVADQGSAFIGDAGATAARKLGISLAPIPSHQPQANGDHEVMHQSFLRCLPTAAARGAAGSTAPGRLRPRPPAV